MPLSWLILLMDSKPWAQGPMNKIFLSFLLIFSQFDLQWKFILIAVSLDKSHIWENFDSWEIGQNAQGQSDCRIFKSTKNWVKKPDFLHIDTDSLKLEVD